MGDELLVRVERGVGVLTLNRPERRNALTYELLEELAAALVSFEQDDEVGAVLLTGAGGAFCAGGDVKAFAERGGAANLGADQLTRQRALQRATVGKLYEYPKPTVAALPGAAAGAGMGFALACDLRFGCPSTLFATAFASIALSGDFGVAWLLTRVAGPARARRLLLGGERVDAATALGWGMLDFLVPDTDVVADALACAERLAAGPAAAAAAYAAMRLNLLDAGSAGLGEAMDREVARHLETGGTDEHRAAVRAFVEKRQVTGQV